MMFSFCKPTVCIAVMLMCAWDLQWNSPPKNLVLVGGHLVCGITPTGTSWIFNSYRPVLYVSSNIHGKQTHDLWLATNTLDKTWCRISFFGMINEFPILNIKIKNTKAKKYIQAQQKKKYFYLSQCGSVKGSEYFWFLRLFQEIRYSECTWLCWPVHSLWKRMSFCDVTPSCTVGSWIQICWKWERGRQPVGEAEEKNFFSEKPSQNGEVWFGSFTTTI